MSSLDAANTSNDHHIPPSDPSNIKGSSLATDVISYTTGVSHQEHPLAHLKYDMGVLENGTTKTVLNRNHKERNNSNVVASSNGSNRIKSPSPSSILFATLSPQSPQSPQSPKGNSYLASELNHSSSHCRSSKRNSFEYTNSSHNISSSRIRNGSSDLQMERDVNCKKDENSQKQLDIAIAIDKNNDCAIDSLKCDEHYSRKGEEGNCDNEQKTSRPDSLSGIGRRYITRRTPVSASESSSSPSNTLLTSSSFRTTRLKSPLKSPSKSISPKSLLPTSIPLASSSTNYKANKTNHHHHHHSFPLPTSASAAVATTGALGANDNHYSNNSTKFLPMVMAQSLYDGGGGGAASNAATVQVQEQLNQGSSQSGQNVTASGRQNNNNNSSNSNINNNSLSTIIGGIPLNRSLTSSNAMASHPQGGGGGGGIRTTKASRLRAAALDKKKETFHDDHSLPHTPITHSYTRYTSPRYHTVIGCGNTSDTNRSGDDMMTALRSPARRIKIGVSALKKSPSPAVSTGTGAGAVVSTTVTASSTSKKITSKPVTTSSTTSTPGESSPQIFKRNTTIPVNDNNNSTECTVKIGVSLKPVEDDGDDNNCSLLARSLPNNDPSDFIRSRSSTVMNSGLTYPKSENIELSPVKSIKSSISSKNEERDKSAKRKSNLNRALNEEATLDDDAAVRRRRRRELGMARQLIPTDETSTAIRDVLSPIQKIHKEQQHQQQQHHRSEINSPISPRNDLAFHMENARKEVLHHHQNGSITPDRRRAATVSPKMGTGVKIDLKLARKSPEKCESVPIIRSQIKDQEYAKKTSKRLSDVSRKVDAIRERTKSELAEIKKITAKCNKIAPSSVDTSSVPAESVDVGFVRVVDDLNEKMNLQSKSELDSVSVQEEKKDFLPCAIECEPSPPSKPFVKKDRISFDDNYARTFDYQHSPFSFSYSLDDVPSIPQRRILKARSHEREFQPPTDQMVHISTKLSPILRRKSSEEPQGSATNHIVSILKRRDYTESSSASSNSSPVTFSSSVVDTPTRSSKRQGILKKRSSLDESRYYSRSHSPDERSILVKTARRNSLEDIQTQHGILKQRSYESKSDGGTSNEPHGILKKKDSVSTPSDNHPKHVSISQAVILAAAELCKDIVTSENERDIKPILKTDNQGIRAPKPILKKKPSSETEEIRPILKSSRKSSREESEKLDSDDCSVKPILKIDSPAKRRSLVEPVIDADFVLQRSRSLDNPDERILHGIVDDSIDNDSENAKPTISVAERIKNMEKFISSSSNSLSGAVPKTQKPGTSKREMYKSRFKTQPVTVDEISRVRTAPIDIFKPGSLETLNQLSAATALGAAIATTAAIATKLSPRSLSSISPSSRDIVDQYSPRSITDLNCLSLSSDSGLQTGRIFEMSGIDDSSPKTEDLNSAADKSEISSLEKDDDKENILTTKATTDTEGKLNENSVDADMDGGDNAERGLVRKNSVRARANMFQQLEEKMKQSSDDQLSPRTKKSTPRISTQPSSADEITERDSRITPRAESDAEFEPSSLPLSERLRIFASLSAPNLNSTVNRDSSATLQITNPTADHEPPINEQTTPTSSRQQHLKMRTIGKLIMPTFFSDNNNNTSPTNLNKKDTTVKPIGKIKSPFLMQNNCNEKISPISPKSPPKVIMNGNDDEDCCLDLNCDSGKENYEFGNINVGVNEIKKKFSKTSTTVTNNLKSSPAAVTSERSPQTPIKNQQQTPSQVDEKLAKYFGIASPRQSPSDDKDLPMTNGSHRCDLDNENSNSSSSKKLSSKSKSLKEVRIAESVVTIKTTSTINPSYLRSEPMKRNRAMTVIVDTPERNRNSTKPTLRTRAMTITNGNATINLKRQQDLQQKNFITKYEELKVTKEDLLMASKEFERIFLGAV